MTTMPMSVRKYLKTIDSKRINFHDDAAREMVEVLLIKQGYVSITVPNICEIWFSPDKNLVYKWCHAQLKTKNWIRILDRIWFTNDEYRAMFMLQWLK